MNSCKKCKTFYYSLGNTIIQETDSHPYLGVCITKDLTWNKHIHQITASANHTLAFIRCSLHSCHINIDLHQPNWNGLKTSSPFFFLNDYPGYRSREKGCVRNAKAVTLTRTNNQTNKQMPHHTPQSHLWTLDTYPWLSITSSSPYNASTDT